MVTIEGYRVEKLAQEKSSNRNWQILPNEYTSLLIAFPPTSFGSGGATLPGGVMVARVTLDHLVKVRILSGQLQQATTLTEFVACFVS